MGERYRSYHTGAQYRAERKLLRAIVRCTGQSARILPEKQSLPLAKSGRRLRDACAYPTRIQMHIIVTTNVRTRVTSMVKPKRENREGV